MKKIIIAILILVPSFCFAQNKMWGSGGFNTNSHYWYLTNSTDSLLSQRSDSTVFYKPVRFASSSNSYLPKTGDTYTTTTGNGLSLTSSTVTTGNLMTLTNTGTAAASNTKNVLSISSSGANATSSQTVTGQTITVTNTGTTNTNVGLNVTASGATNNYAALFTGHVGIGTTSPTVALDVVGTVNASTGTFTTATSGKLIGSGLTPSIAGGAGSGTTPTVSVTGTDVAGEITITTDTDPTTSNIFCTVTFATAYSSSVYVSLTPSNDAAALMYGNNGVSAVLHVLGEPTRFRVYTNSVTAPDASVEYKFHYHVIQ